MTDLDARIESVRRLRAAYDKALNEYRRSGNDVAYEREQETWDELVDFVELNGFNYTEHDPRGARRLATLARTHERTKTVSDLYEPEFDDFNTDRDMWAMPCCGADYDCTCD